jgi:hypothetical protein
MIFIEKMFDQQRLEKSTSLASENIATTFKHLLKTLNKFNLYYMSLAYVHYFNKY